MLKPFDIIPENEFRDKGFTLVEVMVTIVIFSFIMLMLFSSFNAFISSKEFISKRINGWEDARVALNRISEDLKTLYVLPFPMYKVLHVNLDADPYRMTGSEMTAGNHLFSTIEFSAMTDAQTDRNRPERISKIKYYVKENKEDSFDLCRSDRQPGSDEDSANCNDPILIKNISGFEIDYVDEEKNAGKNWDSDAEDFGYRMPVFLRITLSLAPDTSGRVFKTAVTIPVNRETIK